MVRYVLLRAMLVLLAAALAGAAGWLSVRGQPAVHERTLTFVLRPSPNLSDAQVPDAVRGLSQQDAQLVNTIGGAIGSQRFLQGALTEADVPKPERYSARSSIRPGSDIVEIQLRGPDPVGLAAVADRYRRLTSSWVGRVYRAYTLEFLEAEASTRPVAPRTSQVIGLATLLGLLLAGVALFVEWKARQRLHRGREPGTEPSGRRAAILVEDSSGQLDRLETALRSYLDQGEDVVRDGPQRLRIVQRRSEGGESLPTRNPS